MEKRKTIIKKATVPTFAKEGSEVAISRMNSSACDIITQANVTKNDLVAIEICSLGPSDTEKGTALKPPNLSGWLEVPLRDELYSEFQLPITLGNDVYAAAFCENLYDSGKDIENFIIYCH